MHYTWSSSSLQLSYTAPQHAMLHAVRIMHHQMQNTSTATAAIVPTTIPAMIASPSTAEPGKNAEKPDLSLHIPILEQRKTFYLTEYTFQPQFHSILRRSCRLLAVYRMQKASSPVEERRCNQTGTIPHEMHEQHTQAPRRSKQSVKRAWKSRENRGLKVWRVEIG
jgi:hypothetical protein